MWLVISWKANIFWLASVGKTICLHFGLSCQSACRMVPGLSRTCPLSPLPASAGVCTPPLPPPSPSPSLSLSFVHFAHTYRLHKYRNSMHADVHVLPSQILINSSPRLQVRRIPVAGAAILGVEILYYRDTVWGEIVINLRGNYTVTNLTILIWRIKNIADFPWHVFKVPRT